MALVLALLAKLSLLAVLGTHSLAAALAALVGGMCCRASGRCCWCATWSMWAIRPAQSKPLADQISGHALIAAFLWCFCLWRFVASAISSIFNSIHHLQRTGCRWDGPLVCTAPAGFYRRLPGSDAAGREIGFYPAPPWHWAAGSAHDTAPAVDCTARARAAAPGTCYGRLDARPTRSPPLPAPSAWPTGCPGAYRPAIPPAALRFAGPAVAGATARI